VALAGLLLPFVAPARGQPAGTFLEHLPGRTRPRQDATAPGRGRYETGSSLT
jgi:hypothetical protein